MVKVMVGHVWPAGEPQIKRRVALAGSLLIGAKVIKPFPNVIVYFVSHHFLHNTFGVIVSFSVKVLNTSVPFFLSHAIDNLNSTGILDPTTSQAAVTTTVTAALVSSY